MILWTRPAFERVQQQQNELRDDPDEAGDANERETRHTPHAGQVEVHNITAMRSISLLLFWGGGAFAPNLALSATRSSHWRHSAPCHLSVPSLAFSTTRPSPLRHDTFCPPSGWWGVSPSLASLASSAMNRTKQAMRTKAKHPTTQAQGMLYRAARVTIWWQRMPSLAQIHGRVRILPVRRSCG